MERNVKQFAMCDLRRQQKRHQVRIFRFNYPLNYIIYTFSLEYIQRKLPSML